MYQTTLELRARWLSMRIALQQQQKTLPVLHRISTPFEFAAAAWSSTLNAWCSELDAMLEEYPDAIVSETKPFGYGRVTGMIDTFGLS